MPEDSVSYTSITTEKVDAVESVLPNWRLMKFVRAIYYAIISQTSYLCFLIMVINHVVYASVLSMMFPLFIFLWGMLSIPRPTKKFWITVITYTQLVIVVKYVFKFEFIRFNDCSRTLELRNDPLCPARIFEIERDGTTTAFDLLLLLALFFHRYVLQVRIMLIGVLLGRRLRGKIIANNGSSTKIVIKFRLALVFKKNKIQ